MRKRGLKSLLIINPGNPTGQLFSLEEMIDFLHQAKDMELVIVDESFIDFAGEEIPSLLHVAGQFSNLLLVRSMSKHCGVPGLRLGYCYSENLYILNHMRQFIPTWNVNTLAQYFLSLLPATDADYHEGRKRLIGDVRWLYDSLKAIRGIDVYPTGANFVLFKIKGGMTAAELQGLLLQRLQALRARLLQQDRHGSVPYPRRLAGPRKRRQAGQRAPDAAPMKRPAVLVVTRRTIRKNKYIDYVGEFHLALLVRLKIAARHGARRRRLARLPARLLKEACEAFCSWRARTSSQNISRPRAKITRMSRKRIP